MNGSGLCRQHKLNLFTPALLLFYHNIAAASCGFLDFYLYKAKSPIFR